MRITIVQSSILYENKQQNIEDAESVIKHNYNSELVLFPEMSFTGFSMKTQVTSEDSSDANSTVNRMIKISKENRTAIGFGWVKDCGERCENHYTITNMDGTILSDYAKIHPFSYSDEDKYFCGGDEIVTFNINDIPFSTFICYDLRFSELFRAVCDKVHAIIIPANWPEKRSGHWKALLRARAIENQVYIFAINCVGNIAGQYYSGDSCVINPNGDVVEMLSDRDGVITYEFVDDVVEFRDSFPVLRDRRPKVYKKYFV